jgi:alpha-1,2-mannosyltransferase
VNHKAVMLRGAVAATRSVDSKASFQIALEHVLLGLMPVVVLLFEASVVATSAHSSVAVDFHDAYYVAGYRLLHEGDPYAWTGSEIRGGIAFVYPAFSALLFAPFALIARGTAGVLFTLVCVALTPLTLWVLRVRDWRIYGVAMLWLPVFSAWETANETIMLVSIGALVWRQRANPVVAGVLTAAAVSLKPFMWPLALWLLVTRRWRASGYGLAAGVVINLVSWSLVGFDKVGVYLRDSGIDARYAWRAGYTVVAAFGHLGFGRSVGEVMTVMACVALVAAILYVGSVKRRERQAFTLTIILMLVASPLVWIHYFAVLLIPMALERPRMNWLWALPVLMWVCPPSLHVHGWQEALAWAVAGTMFISVLRTARE